MEKKKKSKTAKFLENVGLGISFIWMLVFFLPILIYEENDEFFKKKRKPKEPQPDTIKFVCSECGETFTAENKEEELQVHWDMEQDWLQTGTTIDHGLIEYRCTECGTVFEARDIGHYRAQKNPPWRVFH